MVLKGDWLLRLEDHVLRVQLLVVHVYFLETEIVAVVSGQMGQFERFVNVED